MAKTEITAVPGMPQIVITREFNASPEFLFRAHTDPELLVQWLGPRGLAMKVERLDARHGGTWRYIHEDRDGNAFAFHGVFHGTPSPDGITQTSEFEGAPGNVSLESMTFEQRDGKTLLRATATYQSIDVRDMVIESGMETGVVEGYERLDELAEKMAPVS
jgi:uncharacterized protein YndB with AHSA1/START domain